MKQLILPALMIGLMHSVLIQLNMAVKRSQSKNKGLNRPL